MRRERRARQRSPGRPATGLALTAFLKRLRELREAAGLSQADMAERTGMDKGHVSRLEAGRGNPTVATLARYAAALGRRVVFGVADEAGTKPGMNRPRAG